MYNTRAKSMSPYMIKEHSYHCAECDMIFKQKYALIQHLRIHTGDKPFECKICKKSFSQQSGLDQHSRAHSGNKPYQCELCGKHFTQQSGLNQHMRIHTGSKPYQCGLCQKDFRQQSGLDQHLRIHNGVKPYECQSCGEFFRQKAILNKHLKSHFKKGKRKSLPMKRRHTLHNIQQQAEVNPAKINLDQSSIVQQLGQSQLLSLNNDKQNEDVARIMGFSHWESSRPCQQRFHKDDCDDDDKNNTVSKEENNFDLERGSNTKYDELDENWQLIKADEEDFVHCRESESNINKGSASLTNSDQMSSKYTTDKDAVVKKVEPGDFSETTSQNDEGEESVLDRETFASESGIIISSLELQTFSKKEENSLSTISCFLNDEIYEIKLSTEEELLDQVKKDLSQLSEIVVTSGDESDDDVVIIEEHVKSQTYLERLAVFNASRPSVIVNHRAES